MKQLLIDYCTFELTPQQLNEAESRGDGRVIVTGVLQRADAKNHNGRIYPYQTLMREANKYSKTQIKEKRALGELDHPDSSVVNLNNVSHNILGIKWKGKDLIGEVEILCDRPGPNGTTVKGTPSGNILKSLLYHGIALGISSRGMGSVKELNEGVLEVQDDFELICWDFVSNPSTHGAFMYPKTSVSGMNEGLISEGINKKHAENKYKNIEKIITEIICETKGVCPCIPGVNKK